MSRSRGSPVWSAQSSVLRITSIGAGRASRVAHLPCRGGKAPTFRALRGGKKAAIRRRIKEIEDRLTIRLPVYAVFTKADLLAGFSEFFDDLDRDLGRHPIDVRRNRLDEIGRAHV